MPLPTPPGAARWRARPIARDAGRVAVALVVTALACAAAIVATAPMMAAASGWIGMAAVGVATAVASTTTAAAAAGTRLSVVATLAAFVCGALAAGWLLPGLQANPWSVLVVLGPTLLAGAAVLAVIGVRALGVARGVLLAVAAGSTLFAAMATHAFRYPWYGRIARAHDRTGGDPVVLRWVELTEAADPTGWMAATRESYYLVAPEHRARIAALVARGAPPTVELDLGSGATGQRLQPVPNTSALRRRILTAVAAAERAQLARDAMDGDLPRALVHAPLPAASLEGWAIYRGGSGVASVTGAPLTR